MPPHCIWSSALASSSDGFFSWANSPTTRGMGEDPHPFDVVVELLAWPACGPPARPRPAGGSGPPWGSGCRRRTATSRCDRRGVEEDLVRRHHPAQRRADDRREPLGAGRQPGIRPPGQPLVERPAARGSCTGPAACRAAAWGRTGRRAVRRPGLARGRAAQLVDHRSARSCGTARRGRARRAAGRSARCSMAVAARTPWCQ